MTSPQSTDTVIPVTEEHLEVHREMVDTGRTLRLRKRVEEVSADVRESLATDAVHVERVPIGRVVDVAPPVREEGNVIVVPVIEERLVTRKELVLVEEIRLTRSREVTVAEARVPVRRERVEVERLDPGTGQWLPEPGNQDNSPPPDRK
jgi:stress response protein YsnF